MNHQQRELKNWIEGCRVQESNRNRRLRLRAVKEAPVVATTVRLRRPSAKELAEIKQKQRDLRLAQQAARERYAKEQRRGAKLG